MTYISPQGLNFVNFVPLFVKILLSTQQDLLNDETYKSFHF